MIVDLGSAHDGYLKSSLHASQPDAASPMGVLSKLVAGHAEVALERKRRLSVTRQLPSNLCLISDDEAIPGYHIGPNDKVVAQEQWEAT